ncbi:MAG: hypothetical protein ACLFNI_10975 [Natronomonas sp.]
MASPDRDDSTQPTDDVDPVYPVGIGPGSDGFLPNRATFLLSEADPIVGFETVTDRLDDISDSDVMVCGYDDQTTELERFGRRVEDGASGVAMFWGDPNLWGAQFLDRIATALLDRGVDPELEAYVCENLSLPTESISSTSLGQLAAEAVTDPTPEQYSDQTTLVVKAA